MEKEESGLAAHRRRCGGGSICYAWEKKRIPFHFLCSHFSLGSQMKEKHEGEMRLKWKYYYY